jgi:ABC-type multidrug transport system fused ATPase/permease subunit
MQLVTRQASRLGSALKEGTTAGEVLSVGAADVTRLGVALESTARGAGAVASIVAVGAILLATSVELALVVLLGVPLMGWCVSLLIKHLHRQQGRLRDQQSELTGLAVDIVDGLRVLRGIGGEDVFAARYHHESQRVRHAGVKVAAVEGAFGGLNILLPGLLVTAIVLVGARLLLADEISAGQLVAFYGYAVFLAGQLRRVTNTLERITQGHVAAGRILRLLHLVPPATFGDFTPPQPARSGELADPDSALIVAPGRLTAVVCAASADADRLADRVGRYVDSSVTWGGQPLKDLALIEVRRRVLVVRNDADLFSGPMREQLNPSGRPGAGDEALQRAIHVACADDIVRSTPGGLDGTIVGAGREYSGGQQQRLRLARALMADAAVLVLVEPTNAVDAHTEAHIASRLAAARATGTTLLFTTSPALLGHADSVAYVEDTIVKAVGSHADLLADARYQAVVTRAEGSV